MAVDVVPELTQTIRRSFQDRMMRDRRLAGVTNRIRDGTVTSVDGHVYAERAGINLSGALQDAIREDTLPDGRMYYNIATRTVTPALREVYDLVNEASADILRISDEASGFGLEPVRAEFPQSRIDGLIEKLVDPDYDFSQMIVWLGEPIINNAEAFEDDFVRANADFRSRSGLETTITRTAAKSCCTWCGDLAGSYSYDRAPEDIYRRHEFCRCVVTFHSERSGTSQDVWSKRVWQSSPADLQQRQLTGVDEARITAEERINQAERMERDRQIAAYMAATGANRRAAQSRTARRR